MSKRGISKQLKYLKINPCVAFDCMVIYGIFSIKGRNSEGKNMTIKANIKRKKIELVESEEKLIKDLLSQCFVYLTEEQRIVAASINSKLISKR